MNLIRTVEEFSEIVPPWGFEWGDIGDKLARLSVAVLTNIMRDGVDAYRELSLHIEELYGEWERLNFNSEDGYNRYLKIRSDASQIIKNSKEQ